MTDWKPLKRRWRKLRDRLFGRLIETRLGREMVVNALPGRVLSMTTDCGDHVLTFSPHDYIGRKVYRKGHFERGGIKRLVTVLEAEGALNRGKVLLELGGNIGTQTIYWAKTGFFPRIVTIEPDPRNFAFLSRNIRDNGLESMVTLVQSAAGDCVGMIDFYQNPDNHGKSSALRSSPRDRMMQVPVRPVEQVLTEHGIAPSDIGLIWMDIEGYEPVACRSMEGLMQAGVPLYMEFSPEFYGGEADAFRQSLARFYGRAFTFFEGKPLARMNPAELPLGDGQFDVLLLP